MMEHGNFITTVIVTLVGFIAILSAGLKVYWSLHNQIEKNREDIQENYNKLRNEASRVVDEARQDFDKLRHEFNEQLEQLRVQNAKQQHMIETSWQYVMDSAQLAAQKSGLGKMRSPLKASETAHEIFDRWGLTEELHEFYRQVGRHMERIDLEMNIVNRFRDKMIMGVCIEQGWTAGECIAVAVAIAKEADNANPADVAV